MQKARAFFFVCAGLFLLALSYHLGARNATAQAPSNPVVATFWGGAYVVTANGDCYQGNEGLLPPWTYKSNVFSDSPTPAQRETWGAMKSRYRGERGAAQPAPQDK